MKKMLVLTILAILCSCASGGKMDAASPSANIDLDAAIRMASMDINNALPEGTKVALLNFTSPSDVFSDYVLEEMSISLVQWRKLVVVDRKEIDLIREEMAFQTSGEVSDSSAQSIGQKLGAQNIVSGSLVSMGDTYRFRTKVINVESAAIATSSSIAIKEDPQMKHLLSQGKNSSKTQTATASSGTKNTASAAPSQPAAPAPTVYKVGDTGPAGGIIFYDKGNNNGGWRYLEAAPEEAEFQAQWSVNTNYMVENVREEIGQGKRNTQLIVQKFSQTSGEWDNAAQKANDLVFNGFDDWFLPSKAELDQMYGNLKRRNLGDFKNDWYWSSTVTDHTSAYGQDFKDGRLTYSLGRKGRYYVRPIRQF